MKEVNWEYLSRLGSDVSASSDKCLVIRADSVTDMQMVRWNTEGSDHTGDRRTIAWYTQNKPVGLNEGCFIVWKSPRFRVFLSGQTGARIEDSDMKNITFHSTAPDYERQNGMRKGVRNNAGPVVLSPNLVSSMAMQNTGMYMSNISIDPKTMSVSVKTRDNNGNSNQFFEQCDEDDEEKETISEKNKIRNARKREKMKQKKAEAYQKEKQEQNQDQYFNTTRQNDKSSTINDSKSITETHKLHSDLASIISKDLEMMRIPTTR